MPLLFSYGTLQQNDVQLALFGRALEGRPDELIGFEQSFIEIDEPDGKAVHAIVRFNGRRDSRVRGTLLDLTDHELTRADAYEPSPYVRVPATLASGTQAWVYADGRTMSREDPR
jgi:hypothetical protein